MRVIVSRRDGSMSGELYTLLTTFGTAPDGEPESIIKAVVVLDSDGQLIAVPLPYVKAERSPSLPFSLEPSKDECEIVTKSESDV